ncbi:MAG: hypothetical protein ACFE8N_08770 [Promethearchaeota archaeon]
MESEKKIVKEFLAIRDKFAKIGFELIGTKDINTVPIYFVKEKKK